MSINSYSFRAPFEKVDFSRILQENQNAECVLVSWKDRTGRPQAILLVQPDVAREARGYLGYYSGALDKTKDLCLRHHYPAVTEDGSVAWDGDTEFAYLSGAGESGSEDDAAEFVSWLADQRKKRCVVTVTTF